MAFYSSSFGHEGTLGEFEWVDSGNTSESFQLLKEGYLNMTVAEEEGETGGDGSGECEAGQAAVMTLRKRGSFSKVSRRECGISVDVEIL